LQELAAWYQSFTSNFSNIGSALGFSPAEVTAVTYDNENIQFVAETAVMVTAYRSAVRQFRVILTEGSIGDPAPAFPADITPIVPTPVPTGIFERLNDLVKRIRVAPAYTDEIGALLGIIPAGKAPQNEGELKPKILVSGGFSNYRFTLRVARLGMDAFSVEIRRLESEDWNEIAVGTASPIDVTVEPTTPGKPERVQVRVILISKNQLIGQPSDPAYITVNP
jgi:hypothetical protein